MAKTAFVTGNRGLIGTHITRALMARGYRVLGVDYSATDDAKSCFRRLTDRFDLVVHCAYVVGGRATIDGVNAALIENTMLDSMLFDWALRTKQKAVIYFSSSAAYPVSYQNPVAEHSYQPINLREEFIYTGGDTPVENFGLPDANYGAAKLHGERLAKVASDNGLRVHILRPFSGYAETQSYDYPFPSIVRRAKNNEWNVWGKRGQTRQWIYVDDVVEGALTVYENDERRPVNLGQGDGTEMGDLMRMVARQLGKPEPEIEYLEDQPMGVFYRVGDLSRMHEHYKAKVTLEEGIRLAIEKM